MKYMGSKSKVAKFIVPIIQSYIDDSEKKIYIEPFVGGANIIDKIKASTKIGSDNQKYLIELYKNVERIAELPEFVSREHYSDVRNDYNNNCGKYEDWYIGAIGFFASYNGRFFDGGYAGKVNTKEGIRNYYKESIKNIEKQLGNLQDIFFTCRDYREYQNTEGVVYYCDPPYDKTKGYKTGKEFVKAEFWEWVRKLSQRNIVIVSEYEAPEDFECIWEKDIKRTMNQGKTKKVTDKLFRLREEGKKI